MMNKDVYIMESQQKDLVTGRDGWAVGDRRDICSDDGDDVGCSVSSTDVGNSLVTPCRHTSITPVVTHKSKKG